MKQLNPLKREDTIGIFSPSLWSGDQNESRKFIESKGYKICLGALYGKRNVYRSGTVEERAAELNQLIENPEITCIMASKGGYLSNGILPYINYDEFKKNPKIIIGKSDATAVLFAIYKKTGITTFYGPNFCDFSQISPYGDDTFHAFEQLASDSCEYPHTLPHYGYWTDEQVHINEKDAKCIMHESQMITLHPGKSTGRLIAGNLNTFEGIMASQYMPEIKEGDILLIEDCKLDAESIEREFQMLKICGILDIIGGLVIGKHADYNDGGTGKRNYEILMDVIGKPWYPILAEFDCSHTFPMLTVPIGGQIELDASNKTMAIIKSPFSI